MLFKAKMLFSAARGKRKPFCVLIRRFPHAQVTTKPTCGEGKP